MKLIVDIPQGLKIDFENENWTALTCMEMKDVLMNGTPIPDNATNGDVIKAIFDVTEEHFYDEDKMVDVYGLDRTDEPSTFYADWWNASYPKDGTNRKNCEYRHENGNCLKVGGFCTSVDEEYCAKGSKE